MENEENVDSKIQPITYIFAAHIVGAIMGYFLSGFSWMFTLLYVVFFTALTLASLPEKQKTQLRNKLQEFQKQNR